MIHLSPLTACPTCGYVQNPPKSEGRCPECAFQFQPGSIHFRPTPRLKEHAIGLLIVAIIANAWHWFFRTPVSICFDVVFSIVGLYLLTRLSVHMKRRTHSIVLNHDAISTIVDGRTRTWPLDTIKNVERYSFFPKLLLHDGSWLALSGVFDSSGEWLTFARLLLNFKASQFDGVEAVVEEFRKPANLPVWTINKWPMKRKPLAPRQKKAQRMSFIGLGSLVLAYLVFLPILLGMNPGKEPPVVALVLMPALYGGAILFLLGQWRSDPRSTDAEAEDGGGKQVLTPEQKKVKRLKIIGLLLILAGAGVNILCTESTDLPRGVLISIALVLLISGLTLILIGLWQSDPKPNSNQHESMVEEELQNDGQQQPPNAPR